MAVIWGMVIFQMVVFRITASGNTETGVGLKREVRQARA